MKTASGLFTLISLAVVFGQNSERSCPCTYGGIWLDIIAVIDNSNSMTQAGLAEVSATLATIAGQLPLSQSIGQFSRLSLISFSGGYQVLGDLHAYQGPDDAIPAIYTIAVNNTANLNIEGALQAAGQVIAGSHDRANVKTVILLFASAYSSGGFTDPLPAANQIKEGGTPIITVAFSQADTSSQVNKIATLASPGFAVNSTDNNVINEVFLALCQVNCFCPANWVQFTNNYDNPTSKFGECLRYQDIDSAWTPAKFACPSELSGAHLYQEFTAQKHSFVQRMVSQTPTYNGNGQWLIGLFYDGASNNYYWLGPNGSNVTLGSYSNWDAGYPQVAYGTVVALSRGRWQNVKDLTTPERYVCQATSCDTQNYCASV